MVLSYATYIQKNHQSFFLRSAICHLVALCLGMIVPCYDNNY